MLCTCPTLRNIIYEWAIQRHCVLYAVCALRIWCRSLHIAIHALHANSVTPNLCLLLSVFWAVTLGLCMAAHEVLFLESVLTEYGRDFQHIEVTECTSASLCVSANYHSNDVFNGVGKDALSQNHCIHDRRRCLWNFVLGPQMLLPVLSWLGVVFVC
jgi:hypothetical protein